MMTPSHQFKSASVSASYFKALLSFAVSMGATKAELLKSSRVEEEWLVDPDKRISFESFRALMGASQTMTETPALALYFGECIDFTEFSIVGLIANTSESLGEALTQINRYGKLVVDVDGVATGDRMQVEEVKGELWLVDTRVDPDAFPELTEATFARMICSHRREFGDVSFVKEVHFTHEAPTYYTEYERIFAKPVVFQSSRNALLMSGDFMTRRLSPSKQYLSELLLRHADFLSKQLDQENSVRQSVETELLQVLHKADISVEYIASKLGLSRTSLYRHLKLEDVSFSQLRDELRHKMALYYLDSKGMSVKQAAYLTGFSHPNAFIRAFKRWTGVTPMQNDFRKGLETLSPQSI